jgi:Domain of unknown function DUF29
MADTTDRAIPSLYDKDFALWARQQAVMLREGHFDALDIENLAQEVEDLAKSERRELGNRIGTIIEHMLKLDVPTAAGPRAGWLGTIRRNHQAIKKLLEQNPSLKREVDAIIKEETQPARELAMENLKDYGEQPKSLASHAYTRKQVLPFLEDPPEA